MIIPTPEFDPLFADDGIPFRRKMWEYIQREFAEELGSQTALLECEAGLAVVAARSLQPAEEEENVTRRGAA